MKKHKKYVLGIGGYIGSGKSTAGKFFQKLGARFIDADEVVDELYGEGEDGYRKILSFFGEEYFLKDGRLNRKKLAKTVFNDPKKLRILHDLIHPLVTNRIQQMVDREDARVFVLEATYFEKKHLKALIDGLLWIDCPKNVAFERLRKIRPIERSLFEKILRIQVQPLKKDFVVDNSGSRQKFEDSLLKVWKRIDRS